MAGPRAGAVRDLDVFQDRLRDLSGDLPDVVAALFATLQGRRDAAGRALREMLDEERYQRITRTCPGSWTGPTRS